jgi:hypothetical protein
VFLLILLGALAFGMVTLLAPGAFSQGGSATPVPAAPPVAAPPAGSTAPAPGATPAPGAASPAAAGGYDFAANREEIFKAFYQTGLDTSKAYAVTNLAIKKDNMTLLLKQGTVFLMQPIGGEITGAAFIGDGEASMTPPNRTQRFMLNKYYGAETLKEPFTETVFRFSDKTDRMMIGAGKPVPASDAAISAKASQVFSERNGWLDGTRQLHLEMQFLENRISDLKNQDFFVADFHTGRHDWLTYTYNPQEVQENKLTASETLGAKSRRYLVPWCRWHKQADYNPSGYYVLLPDRDGPRVIQVKHQEMTLNLRNTKTIEWEAKTTVQALGGTIRCLRFDLVNNGKSDDRWYDDAFWPSKVLSVADVSGSSLLFMHKKDQLLVLLPGPTSSGSTIDIVSKGQADMIYQVTAESFGLLQPPWYPQYGQLGGRFTFHWTIRVPRPFTITGSGRLVREFEDKDTNQNGIETVSDIPVTFPWLIFGKFRKAEDTYLGEESNKSVKLSIYTVSIQGSGTPDKKVQDFFTESKDILKLYENIYGPYPYEELHIAQMEPGRRAGQSPPYFVQLTGDLFQAGESKLGKFSIHDFLSHEIAHQWWGNQVGWASEDDDWLSEGFASYAAGVFIHALQKNAGLQAILDGWRQEAKAVDKEAPIVAAGMLAGPNASDFRTRLLYNKAPYVLHMLRVQLDDEKYREVMRSINETYKHHNISTEMLLREVNRVTGSDYTYFFDQWIWDVGIPKFRYSWRSEKQPDGKFLITVHIGQEDTKHLKRVLMPIHIHFKDKTIPQYKPVTQGDQDIKLLSPAEPKDVTLDDDHSLLADIVKAG